MKHILFVDDEVRVLDGLRRMLRPLRSEWNMEFVGGAEEALVRLDQAQFDVVVSDMRMPGMDGAQFLTEVMRRHPQTVRIILSGQSDQEMLMKSVGPTHQFLAKPCEAEMLTSTVARACALRDQLADDSLKQLTSQVKTLPSLPSTYAQMMEELQSPDVSIKRIGELVGRDVAMTAKILQLVNSAFFGLPRTVSDPAWATTLLGVDTIRALVLSVGIFTQFEGADVPGFSLDDMCQHSMRVAALARAIARTEGGDKRVADDAFMAGVLHDVGELVLIANLPQQYADALAMASSRGIPAYEAERALLGATHADVGGYLMGLWGLPDPIVEAIVFHHSPEKSLSAAFGPLTAVHAADSLVHECRGEKSAIPSPRIDHGYLVRLNIADRVPIWRELCADQAREGAQE